MDDTQTTMKERLLRVQTHIAQCCEAAGRDADAVQLLAVSKTFANEQVQQAHELGLVRFGENRAKPNSWACCTCSLAKVLLTATNCTASASRPAASQHCAICVCTRNKRSFIVVCVSSIIKVFLLPTW